MEIDLPTTNYSEYWRMHATEFKHDVFINEFNQERCLIVKYVEAGNQKYVSMPVEALRTIEKVFTR